MTDEERGFIVQICKSSNDQLIKLAYSDWLREHERCDESEAWKWIALFKRKPIYAYKTQGGSHLTPGFYFSNWYNSWVVNSYKKTDNIISLEFPYSRYYLHLPTRIYHATCYRPDRNWEAYIEKAECFRFASLERAYQNLVQGFIFATTPHAEKGWFGSEKVYKPYVVDWSLANCIPEER